MNERIKELVKQAGFFVLSNGKIYIPTTSEEITDCQIKFAELIVRECFECIDTMEKIAASNNCSIPVDYDKHTYLETLDTMRGLLGVHFGVE